MDAAGERWTAPVPVEARNYPYHCWWVAGLSSEVGRTLLGRWLLDTPVLLYRREDGTAVALENRCPHRGAPLSLGCLKGDDVQCGYHGFLYGSDGACRNVPSMKAPLPAARLRSFALVEQPPYLWIWLGDPARITDAPPPPRIDWTGDPAFARIEGRMDVAANYLLLKENVLDLTHFGFVHATTFRITDWVDPPRFSSDRDSTGYRQEFRRSPLPGVFAEPLGLAPGTPWNRDNHGSFVSPALQVAAVDLIDPQSGSLAGRFRVSHATTPIDAGHMHYFWAAGRDFGTDAQSMAALEALTKQGFAEDEAMLEAIQALQQRDPRGAAAPEVSVRMDTAGVQARRIVARWMERDA
jgi:phenylpropionate dioxygenase-like ring-hydroxylating dioxygenase large terminal subunit